MASARARNAWFFVVAVPLAWAAASLALYRHPGDEYAHYAMGSAAGCWTAFLLPDLSRPWTLACITVSGVVTMALLGWLELRLGVRKRAWLAVWAVATAVLTAGMLLSFPSLASARAKHGSLASYALTAVLLGSYAATGLTVLATPLVHRERG